MSLPLTRSTIVMTSDGSLATSRLPCALSRAATVNHSPGEMISDPLFSSMASMSAFATALVNTSPGSIDGVAGAADGPAVAGAGAGGGAGVAGTAAVGGGNASAD